MTKGEKPQQFTAPHLGNALEPAGVIIHEPFDGAVLCTRHGTPSSHGLGIHVWGTAPGSHPVTINGQPARREGDRFFGEVILSNEFTEIVVVSGDAERRSEDRVRVLWDQHSEPSYHFAVDDNIYFLRDIAQKKYSSLFDCFYLENFRKLHKKYGTRFSLNVYFTAEDGFTLEQFPDRYIGEWKDNANWLQLAFHAYANKPDRPYQDAPATKLISDYDLVVEQILRFAGSETLAQPTNLHWSMATPEGVKALYHRGVRVLSGYFAKINGRWDINYSLDDRRSEYLNKHGILKDFDSGMLFIRDAIVCNETPVDRIAATLDPLAHEADGWDFINLLTHEQYFWPFYRSHIADHFDRCETAIRWATEHGYRPEFAIRHGCQLRLA